MTDHFTDRLFAFEGEGVSTVRFPISRLVVDPERFEDDALEPMAARGQGVLYERGADGSVIRPRLSDDRRSALLERWYRPHHSRLAAAVNEGLKQAGRVLIIDAHSFPNSPLPLDLVQTTPRPDICIGTTGGHTPSHLIDATSSWCERHGWTLGVDTPYSGSIVPLEHLGRNASVASIMIEVNRARYMRLEGDRPLQSEQFHETGSFVSGLLRHLRTVAAERYAE